jgi:hypothetical protein
MRLGCAARTARARAQCIHRAFTSRLRCNTARGLQPLRVPPVHGRSAHIAPLHRACAATPQEACNRCAYRPCTGAVHRAMRRRAFGHATLQEAAASESTSARWDRCGLAYLGFAQMWTRIFMVPIFRVQCARIYIQRKPTDADSDIWGAGRADVYTKETNRCGLGYLGHRARGCMYKGNGASNDTELEKLKKRLQLCYVLY